MSILAALVDSLVDIAASLTNLLVVRYSLQPADEEHTLATVRQNRWPRWHKACLSPVGSVSVLTGIQHLARPEPMAAGVGIAVTLIALVSTLVLVTFQRWVVRKRKVRRCEQICFIISLML